MAQMAALDEVKSRLRVEGLSFSINGETRVLADGKFDPEQTVLEYLRAEGLTGTKLVCGEGGCGACTVICSSRDAVTREIRHRPLNSCLTTIGELDGCHVTTVEGLAKNGDKPILHPISHAMSYSHGSQCGYCTPGMVMSMYGLWNKSKEIQVKDIEEHLDGNLCRCTGYRPILQAFQPFAKDYQNLLASGSALPEDSPVTPCTAKDDQRCCAGHNVPKLVTDESIEWGEEVEQKLEHLCANLPERRASFLSGTHIGHRVDFFPTAEARGCARCTEG